MNGGLDQQIQQKVDAYRGNPRALMQRYQQNQQLLDLLALQKLKSEKEAAARQMQMQMQQQPQTVAQQREQEVLGLTKQELAQQTQGIMQQRQAQQQKNLQQVAQGGIGALLQRPQAAPQPVPRMAGGGIVAFQPGGQVEAATPFGRWLGRTTSRIGEDLDLQRLRQRVQMKYGTMASPLGAFRRQTDEERARAQEILRDLPTMSREQLEMLLVEDRPDAAPPAYVPASSQEGFRRPQGASRTDAVREVMDLYGVGAADALSIILRTQGDTYGPEGSSFIIDAPVPSAGPQRPIGDPSSIPAGDIVDLGVIDIPAEGQDFVRPAPGGPGQLPSAAPNFVRPTLPGGAGGLPAAETEQPEPPAIDAGGGGGGGGIASLDLGGPEAAMRRGFAISDEYLGRGEKAARYAEMEAELARLDEGVAERARDPNRRLTQFLLGGGGQSSAAGAFGAAGRSLLAYDEGVDRQERERLISRIALAERGMGVDSELGRAGLQLGQTMFSEAAQNQRTAMQAANNMKVEEFRQMREDARQQATNLRLDRQFQLDSLTQKINAATERRLSASQAFSAAADVANRVSTARNDLIESLLANDQSYLMASMQLSQAESAEEQQRAKAAVDAILAMTTLRANTILDETKDANGISMLSVEQRALEFMMYSDFLNAAGISPADVQTTTYTE